MSIPWYDGIGWDYLNLGWDVHHSFALVVVTGTVNLNVCMPLSTPEDIAFWKTAILVPRQG